MTDDHRDVADPGRLDDQPLGLQAGDRAGHRRRLHPLGAGQVADRLAVGAEEQPEHRHGGQAQVVLRGPLRRQPSAQPHHRDAELGGEGRVRAADGLCSHDTQPNSLPGLTIPAGARCDRTRTPPQVSSAVIGSIAK